MHNDESLPESSRAMAVASANPGIRLPIPTWAKGVATPGGVPPMFAANVHSSAKEPVGLRSGASPGWRPGDEPAYAEGDAHVAR